MIVNKKQGTFFNRTKKLSNKFYFCQNKINRVKDILDELNEAQKTAVAATEGPVLILAGAGSGKTRALTYRVAFLVSKGIDPFNIIALTFTNKAAREMKERIVKLVGSDARNVWMGTFHSIFSRILRIESDHLGFPANFSIYDSEDSRRLIKTIIKEFNLNDKIYVPNYVHQRISAAKTSLISAEEYNENTDLQAQDHSSGKPQMGLIYTTYNQRLRKSAAMDFDDLLFFTYVLLDKFPDVLYKYQKIFKYILVDEYQDTNHVQYIILKKLAADNENICVVGDDAQSIYAFRGANIENILNFKKDYSDVKIFKLEQNYRSTGTIVKAANSVISKNKNQFYKEIWTENDEGQKIKIFKAASDGDEGRQIADSIFERKMNLQLPNNHFAILYRTNAQSRSLEEALRRLNIPYRIYGGLSFYKRKEIKDLLAYFQLTINNHDEQALMRIINYPQRGIGDTTLNKFVVAAGENKVSIWETLSNPDVFKVEINHGTKNKISDFITLIKSFSVMLLTHNAFDMAKHIASSCGLLKELYDDKSVEGVSRYENIEELLNAIKEFTEDENVDDLIPEESGIVASVKSLDEFMKDIALLTDADEKDDESIKKVSLMTIHAAKGLEFPYVYITGLEENLFPSAQSLSSRADLEEERRLFYVAITRAQKQVFLSFAENRYRWGNLTFCEPSRFLEDIDPVYIEMPKQKRIPQQPVENRETNSEPTIQQQIKEKIKSGKFKKITVTPSSSPTENNSDLSGLTTGADVEHERFGKGKVIGIEGSGSNIKATVQFQTAGKKQLLLKFAKLKIL